MKTDEQNFDQVINAIHELEGHETQKVLWLMSLLNSADGSIRLAALNALVHRFSVPNLSAKLWSMLDTETDEDVLLVLFSALSKEHSGSKDRTIIQRFQNALDRLEDCLDGTRESFDDSKLRIMFGYDTKQIVKMSSTERAKQLAEVDEQLAT